MDFSKMLIIADIDGTLADKGQEMGPITRQAFQELHRLGAKLGIASGRPASENLIKRSESWELGFKLDVIVGMNGGQVLDQVSGKYEEFYKLKKEYIKEIIEMMEPTGLNPFVYKTGYMLSQYLDERMSASAIRNHEPAIPAKHISELWEEDNAKLLFRLPDDLSKVDDIVAFAKAHPKPYYQSFLTGPMMLEFQDPRVNKGLAVQKYCEENGIDLKDVIAFGDATNDNEMLQVAGLGVCLQNGIPSTKAVADVVMDYTCAEDGVGRYLYDTILKNLKNS